MVHRLLAVCLAMLRNPPEGGLRQAPDRSISANFPSSRRSICRTRCRRWGGNTVMGRPSHRPGRFSAGRHYPGNTLWSPSGRGFVPGRSLSSRSLGVHCGALRQEQHETFACATRLEELAHVNKVGAETAVAQRVPVRCSRPGGRCPRPQTTCAKRCLGFITSINSRMLADGRA
jgi:hypothetical protein